LIETEQERPRLVYRFVVGGFRVLDGPRHHAIDQVFGALQVIEVAFREHRPGAIAGKGKRIGEEIGFAGQEKTA
jgi:hypothetical protein